MQRGSKFIFSALRKPTIVNIFFVIDMVAKIVKIHSACNTGDLGSIPG